MKERRDPQPLLQFLLKVFLFFLLNTEDVSVERTSEVYDVSWNYSLISFYACV